MIYSNIYIKKSCNNKLLYQVYKIIDFFYIKTIELFIKISMNYWYNENLDINIINEINK